MTQNPATAGQPQDVPQPSQPEKWERMNGEPNDEFDLFHRFLLLGPRRSVSELLRVLRAEHEKSGTAKPPSRPKIDSIRRKNHWDERSEAFDEWKRKDDMIVWSMRRGEIREMEFEGARKLYDKAVAMLQFPLAKVEKKSEDGREITIVTPGDWTFSDAARLIESASKLARIAADLSVGKVDVNHTVSPGGAPPPTTPEGMSDHELLKEFGAPKALPEIIDGEVIEQPKQPE